MSGIAITGWGAVSPAGWSAQALWDGCNRGKPLPISKLEHPGISKSILGRRVPKPSSPPPFLRHPRLRRSSSISHFATAAALEAIGDRIQDLQNGRRRLGIIFTAMIGCVNYSVRFYKEALQDPGTASPIVFPETVFNAPASHLGTYLGTNAISYTLVGDQGSFLQGMAMGADWILEGRVDGCLVVGADEFDLLIASAHHLFDREAVASEGAGALFLEKQTGTTSEIQLDRVTQPKPYGDIASKTNAARTIREQFAASDKHTVLCDSLTGLKRLDHAETLAWSDWSGSKLSVKPLIGDPLSAGSAWQCVVAAEHLSRRLFDHAIVNVIGYNGQVIAAQFSTVGSNS